jgi:hypothetical protein
VEVEWYATEPLNRRSGEVSTQQFKYLYLTKIQEVFTHWPFFLEGLGQLNTLVGCMDPITEEVLLKTLLHAVDRYPRDGLVVVVTSKNDKPLLWGVALNNTALFKPRSCVVYAVYSNNKAAGVVSSAIQCLEQWARENEYVNIQAFSPSFNGSRIRLFERSWKFRRAAIMFTKKL